MQASINKNILNEARGKKILVVGDLMLDEFIWGRVARISPEAPVPIVEVSEESLYPGGAANVGRNLRPFCAEVEVCGIVGEDVAAEKLAVLFRAAGISTSALVVTDLVPTTVKTRIIARQQQVVRVDRERTNAVTSELRRQLLDRISEILPRVDGVIFEDYGKGLLDQDFVDSVIALATAAGKIVTADPNPKNRFLWTGVTLLKPNRSEAFAMTRRSDPGPVADPLHDDALLEVVHQIIREQNIQALLVTLSEHGMLLVDDRGAVHHTPTHAREVFDVSGAGDTAIAIGTLALCAGASLIEAAELANRASGIVVGKLGTATTTPEELLAEF